MRCSELDNSLFILVLLLIRREWGVTLLHDLEKAMPEYPSKLLLVKASKLIKQGFITGCSCGCRGDFEVTAKGFELIKKGTK